MFVALIRALAIAIPVGFTPTLPLLIVAVAIRSGRFTAYNHSFDWLGTLPVILALAVLVGLDIFGDKVLVVRDLYARAKYLLCPLAGGIAAAAVFDSSDIAWPVVFVAGAVVAGLAHYVKTHARPRLETSPVARAMSGLVSILLDSAVAIVAVAALLLPPLGLVLGLLLLGFGGWTLAQRS